MTDSARGSLGPIYLDGHLLDKVTINDQDFTPRKLRDSSVNVRGSAREGIAYQGAGYPMIGVKHSLLIRFSNLGTQRDKVERIMSVPGPHDVLAWQPVFPTYAGDGDRTTFFLPWRVRDHFLGTYPAPEPPLQAAETAGQLAVEVRIGINGTPLDVLVKNEGDYAAGTPAADEAWFLEGGLEFKLGVVVLSGERVFVRYVPILSMIEEGSTPSRKYGAGQVREPLDLALVEA